MVSALHVYCVSSVKENGCLLRDTKDWPMMRQLFEELMKSCKKICVYIKRSS